MNHKGTAEKALAHVLSCKVEREQLAKDSLLGDLTGFANSSPSQEFRSSMRCGGWWRMLASEGYKAEAPLISYTK